MLHIFLRVIEARLRERSRSPGGRLGAVSFVQRYGSALNTHVHFHCCVIDGLFAVGANGQVHFAEAGAQTPEDLAAVQQQVRLGSALVCPVGHLDSVDARDMAAGTVAGLLAGYLGCASTQRPAPFAKLC